METFYNGLNASTRMVFDASANGAIISKSYNEAYKILEHIANNNYQWSNARASMGMKVVGIHEVDALTALTTQVSSMTNLVKAMSMGGNLQPAPMAQVADVLCVYCGGGHTFDSCPSNLALVCYLGNHNDNRNNPYSNSYNLGWRNHPNFSWGGQGAISSGAATPNKPTYPPSFYQQQQPRAQPPPPKVSQTSFLENLMKEYMAKNDVVIQSQAGSLRNLEIQMGQLANELTNRPQGTLPSDTKNPRRVCNEHCKAITLRNGINLELNVEKSKSISEPTSIQSNVKKGERVGISNMSKVDSEENVAAIPPQNASEKLISKPPPPFPQRFQKQQQDSQFWRFLDVLKQLHINIPLVEALEQIPNYVKFLNDILTKK
ncbi:uncharacterized protein LOC133814200 [Humulus lupulus]|uniref:uncharacterized protein LOC133814200 n=1 Tax=Humulus lupulus TaxID=3486 RepID=UPI002B41073B|nr:uncharacterized protein LOC133814200 [Humulus lupulus]